MTQHFPIFCLVCLCWLIACTNSKSASSNILVLLSENKAFIAWNEDTVNSYQILLTNEGTFSYTIVRKDGLQKLEEYYKGTLKLANDTLFLSYYKGLRPPGVTNYLIIEASRHYLIQPFINDTKRIFLRSQRFSHLH